MRNTICKLFSISSRTYSNIMSAYLSDTRNRVVYSSGKEGFGRSGNRSQKITRIPRTRELQIRVREFVRLCRGRRERVTARQVVDFLEDEGMLHIPVGSDGKWDKKQFEAAYRNTRLFVQDCGYNRGRRTGNLVQKQSVSIHRHNYLKTFCSTMRHIIL